MATTMIPEEELTNSTEVQVVGKDLKEFDTRRLSYPESQIRKLDLSFNLISRICGLELYSDSLEELVLDNNQIRFFQLPVRFKCLHTLSLNKNQLYDLPALLQNLKSNAPTLKYLSLLGNPLCPDRLSNENLREIDYQVYRYRVIYQLKSLQFLDHKALTFKEVREAFRNPNSLYRDFIMYTPLMEANDPSLFVHHRKLGKKSRQYIGKNSEGNKFIRDEDL